MLKLEGDRSGFGCAHHGGTVNHEIKNCEEFKNEVLKLLMFRILRYQKGLKVKEEEEVNSIGHSKDSLSPTLRPRFVFSIPTTLASLVPPRVVIGHLHNSW